MNKVEGIKVRLKTPHKNRPSLPGNGCVLELCLARVPEPGSHSEEVLPCIWALSGGPQPEEGVVFDGALPQMLARFLVPQPENESVLLKKQT